MRILVCLKQVIDPEVPARDFKIDPEKRAAERGSAGLVTNIFCENALETALQFRERVGGSITVLSFGSETAEESLRKGMAMKADSAVLILNEGNPNPDPFTVAQVLAAAVRKIGNFDLILLGREAGDWGAGQTGGLLAEMLDLPCIAFVDHIEPAGDRLRVRRQTEFGYEVFEAALPIVLTITNDEHNAPRIPKVRDVMMSYRQPLTKLTIEDVGVNVAETRFGNSYYEVAELFIPQREIRCEFITGETLEAQIEGFADRLASLAGAS